MHDLFERLETDGTQRLLTFVEPSCGLRALLVIDDTRLGPAAGGIRTWRYPSADEALADARKLARAMTLKCSLAGLDAGGAKMVVLDHADLDRAAAFDVLGRWVEDLRGLFITAGDLGTRLVDLQTMARHTRWVRTDETDLADAVARGLLGCAEACAHALGRDGVRGMTVAVQGCGAIGAAVGRALANAGCEVAVADIDAARADRVARSLGATVIDPNDILDSDVDLLAPCAIGGVIDAGRAGELRARAVCGAANNVLAHADAADVMAQRGVLFVPDTLASAGAVILGICDTMHRSDGERLIAALGDTTATLLDRSRREGRSTVDLARELANARLEASGR